MYLKVFANTKSTITHSLKCAYSHLNKKNRVEQTSLEFKIKICKLA